MVDDVEPGVEEIRDGDTTWRFDRAFLTSNWTCIWGKGCLGILAEPAPELNQGCCSVGAEIDGEDESRRVAGLAATLEPEHFQFHAEAEALGVFDEAGTNTRVVDGACVFLNRPGFAGGEGCALHLAAVADGESPIDWKPSVCWQLPVRVDWAPPVDGVEVAHVRAWSRADWGDDGDPMAWCCTEGDRAYVGDRPVVESLADELEGIVGTAVYVELRRRLTE
ncbi:hypothetical protein KSP35_02530 [Aquihabitans sp. G128]|uniref:hypothetical protein n=1 Tax=Aquihabitans sp. G128 TaxID=2849779 RepID=UPI001C226E3A|nr:hypothetical protein [Aquihabitans sp. G128]QXC61740.1 hypothetical protein KSP35_02530 [Aquihabitans sp. G128]